MIEQKLPVDPYFLGLLAFAGCTWAFTFGNIESSRKLQVVTSMLRYLVIALFFVGTLYSLMNFGRTSSTWFGFDTVDFSYA